MHEIKVSELDFADGPTFHVNEPNLLFKISFNLTNNSMPV